MPDDSGTVKNSQVDGRVAIFIDGSNLYHSLEENCKRTDLDFSAFARKLCKGRPLFRIYYYNILQDPERKPQAYQDQQKFLASLYNTPYLEVRLGSSRVRGDTIIEKGVDIMLATDLLQFAWNNLYDVAILVSGDGDFAYALQAAKNMGKYAELAAFPSNLSWDLAQVADDRQFLAPEFFSDLWIRQRRVAVSRKTASEPEVGEPGERKRWGRRRNRSRSQASPQQGTPVPEELPGS